MCNLCVGTLRTRLEWSALGSDPVALNNFEDGKPSMTQGRGRHAGQAGCLRKMSEFQLEQ